MMNKQVPRCRSNASDGLYIHYFIFCLVWFVAVATISHLLSTFNTTCIIQPKNIGLYIHTPGCTAFLVLAADHFRKGENDIRARLRN